MLPPSAPTSSRPVRALLASRGTDDAQGIEGALAPFSDIVQVVGVVVVDAEIVFEANRVDADVVVIDAGGRAGVGVDASAKVLAVEPEQRVVLLTDNDDLHHLFAALNAGVAGYLLKSNRAEALAEALRQVAMGVTVVDPHLGTQAAILAARTAARLDWRGAHLGLSRREAEVLQLLAAGNGIDETAAKLVVGRETIRTHVRQIYRKLGVRNRAAAVSIAWREGLGS
jgi:DNA-binding NarL/FixJ family response regulator